MLMLGRIYLLMCVFCTLLFIPPFVLGKQRNLDYKNRFKVVISVYQPMPCVLVFQALKCHKIHDVCFVFFNLLLYAVLLLVLARHGYKMPCCGTLLNDQMILWNKPTQFHFS